MDPVTLALAKKYTDQQFQDGFMLGGLTFVFNAKKGVFVPDPAYYYKDGNEIEILTGGWVVGHTVDDPTYSVVYAKEDDHLYIATRRDTMDTQGAYVTDELVDLTNIDKLYVSWEFVVIHAPTDAHNKAYLVVSSQKDGALSVYDARVERGYAPDAGVLQDELDVSGLTGEYYVRIHSLATTQSRGSAIKTYRVWGE